MDFIINLWQLPALRLAAVVLVMALANVAMGLAVNLTREDQDFQLSAFLGGVVRSVVAAAVLAVLYWAGAVCPDIVVLGAGEEALTVPLVLSMVMAGAFGYYFFKDLLQLCRLIGLPIPKRLRDMIHKDTELEDVMDVDPTELDPEFYEEICEEAEQDE